MSDKAEKTDKQWAIAEAMLVYNSSGIDDGKPMPSRLRSALMREISAALLEAMARGIRCISASHEANEMNMRLMQAAQEVRDGE